MNFGWLPSGFTENLPAPGEFPMSQGPLEVMTTQVSFGASTPGGEGLQVTVAARGVKVSPWIGGGTGSSAELTGHRERAGHQRPSRQVARRRPGVGVRERRLGDHPHRRRNRGAVAGGLGTELQDQHPQGKLDSTPTGAATPTPVTSGMETCSPLAQQTATLQAELVKVASNLSWTPTPFTFPYEFTQALPQGWTVGSVTGTFVKGRLISSELDLYSAATPRRASPRRRR